MPLLNYTTEVPATRSIADITRLLQDAGASAIMLENGPEREIVAVSFLMDTSFGRLPFTLPANVPAVMMTLNEQVRQENQRAARRNGFRRKLPKSLFGNKKQAERIAWRIAKDWLEAQIALTQIGAAKFEQIMLPFCNINGQSFYHRMIERGTLALPPVTTDKEPDPAAISV